MTGPGAPQGRGRRLDRRAVVAALLEDRGDLLVVAGLGSPAWDVAAAGDHERDFPLWGAMGGAVMVGLGLAIARPAERVLVVTGDGELLMGLGSLATVAVVGPANLAVVVLDNERYGETGGQPTHTAGPVDLGGVAAACGWPTTLTARTEADVARAVHLARGAPGPALVVAKVADDPLPLVLPPRDGAHLVERFRGAVLRPSA